jgi:hypothetical protein
LVSVAHEAEWFNWIGVGVALSGVLIAEPDGVAVAWGWLVAAARRLVGRRQAVHDVSATGTMKLGGEARARRWQQWEPGASETRKVEVLHLQVELLLNEQDKLAGEMVQRFADLRGEMGRLEARLHGVDAETVRRVEATEQRAARVDARGLWPVFFGIVLTGLSTELASAAEPIGWLVVTFAAAVTAWTGLLVWRDRRRAVA